MKITDERPALNFWAPGRYYCKCLNCNEHFFGAKLATQCADCAYYQEEQEKPMILPEFVVKNLPQPLIKWRFDFRDNTGHYIYVIVWKTLAEMRIFTKAYGDDKADLCAASVRDAKSDGTALVAEVFLNTERMNVDIITHEAVHVAYAKAKRDKNCREENIAQLTGEIAETIIAHLSQANLAPITFSFPFTKLSLCLESTIKNLQTKPAMSESCTV